MISHKTTSNYWFTIEPYVYIGLTNTCALLYNTLDGATIESDKEEVIELLQEVLIKENCGVVLLTDKKYQNININAFIRELREKYMGDIIDVALSKGKPVQLLPFVNFPDKHQVEKRSNFLLPEKIYRSLTEISIHVEQTTNIIKLISFLQSLHGQQIFNIIGNIWAIANYDKLLSFFDQHSSPKNILCSYTNVMDLQPTFSNNFSYKVSVNFPIDIPRWNISREILHNQTLPFEYIFDISSEEDTEQAKQFINQYNIEQYKLNPVYNGDNIRFFEENVFLTKEDILSTPLSIKDLFANQLINIYDFGKINIMPNGNAFANVKHPALGNIYVEGIYNIVRKEIDEGKSWFQVRDQAPCNNCVYQWLCPPPSNYETAIGRPNLCHVKQL